MLPVERLKQAADNTLSNKVIFTEGFAYGPDEGYFPLRKNIANWLSRYYAPAQPISAERICITGGASQNLACVLQVFTDPAQTEIIWLVEPTYHLVFWIFEDAGFSGRMRGIPEDEEGMDVAALERALDAFERSGDSASQDDQKKRHKPHRPYRKIYKHVIYCVPCFSNPSGTTMSHSRREALIRVARKYNALVVADDVYDFLSWGVTHPAKPVSCPQLRLVDIDRVIDGGPEDRFGNVVSNGSFSKLIGPGCRVGWAEGTEDFIHGLSQAGSTRSGGAPSQLTSTFINELLEDNFLPEYIANIIVPEGRRRHCLLASAIKTHLGHFGVSFTPDPETNPVAGGYYIWIQLPAVLTATQVCQEALELQNLVLGCGETFAVPGGNAPGGDLHRRLRLCFMWEDEGRLVEGVGRLGLVIQSILTKVR
ncbi:unnamed protein product [Penicillium egyptiacum]|uniref:Aminotransferase class I/classII large domain-containing protein n=1 Tax=Penicillium egyptiacum TaxID=1303716 RepID=A0A9W4K603_9EURO|nr:unnamed protein product [Penicillium egyptiacum]